VNADTTSHLGRRYVRRLNVGRVLALMHLMTSLPRGPPQLHALPVEARGVHALDVAHVLQVHDGRPVNAGLSGFNTGLTGFSRRLTGFNTGLTGFNSRLTGFNLQPPPSSRGTRRSCVRCG